MLFLPSIGDLDEQCGDYTRDQLEAMDAAFVARVEAAFQVGLDSRAAAAATVRIGRNGSRRLVEDSAIESAWNWFRDVKFEATAVEVLARVRASCPGISVEEVREGFRRRLMEMCG